MRRVVRISDFQWSNSPEDHFVTHGLGSCVGVTMWDPNSKIGGMLHFLMPQVGKKRNEPDFNPFKYGDFGISLMIRKLEAQGANKSNLVVCMAGGAAINLNVNKASSDVFNIGQRNHTIARKILWKEGVVLRASDVGGNISRTLYLDIDSGNSWFVSSGKKVSLYGI